MDRPKLQAAIQRAFKSAPIVALLGPRQVGKTTEARVFAERDRKFQPRENHFDLEDITHLSRLEQPKLALESLKGLVVIDEVQRRPDLFPVLRVLVDRPKNRTRFLILGSASRDLLRQASESLAGRIQFVETAPFALGEIAAAENKPAANLDRLWLRGGFPRSYLARTDVASQDWREGYVRTFLERDIPMLGFQVPPLMLRRFWMMLTHYHGQTFNASEIGKSLGIADTTAKGYLDLLAGTFMIRRLQPWFEKIQKRQVKQPKIYFRDSGILHTLMNASTRSALFTHPRLGASWEGFALEEVLKSESVREEDAFFWGVHAQAELGLLLFRGGRRHGFEFKFTDAPKMTSSMRQAIETLGLATLTVVVPGSASFALDKHVHVRGLQNLVAP